MSDIPKPIVVACALIHDQQKDAFLMGKRAIHKHNGGMWEFMGGKKEADETIQQALEREIEEEISAKGKAAEVLKTIVHQHQNGPLVELHFIKFTLSSDAEIKPDPEVYENVSWIIRQNVLALNLSDGDRLFAETLFDLKT